MNTSEPNKVIIKLGEDSPKEEEQEIKDGENTRNNTKKNSQNTQKGMGFGGFSGAVKND